MVCSFGYMASRENVEIKNRNLSQVPFDITLRGVNEQTKVVLHIVKY